MKKFLSCLLAFLLIITPMVQSVHAEEISEEELYGEVRDTLEMIFDIEDELEKLGLTFEDLLSIQEKDEKFYEELRQYLQEQGEGTDSSEDLFSEKFSDINGEMTPFESDHMKQFKKEEADRWAYAAEMALLNLAREKRDFDNEGEKLEFLKYEISYMFLSHFIDLTTRKIAKVNRDISDDGYYSAWITGEDRRVYGIYLAGVGRNQDHFNLAKLTLSIGLNIRSAVKGSRESWDKLKKSIEETSNSIKLLANLYLVGSGVDDAKEEFKAMVNDFNLADSPQKFITNFNKYLAEKGDPEVIRKQKIKIFLNLVASGVAGGGIGFITGLGIELLKKYIEEYETFFYNIWWLALVRTNSLRRGLRAERYLRYHGMLP